MSENCVPINVSLRYTQTLNLVPLFVIFSSFSSASRFFCFFPAMITYYCVPISDFRGVREPSAHSLPRYCVTSKNATENINNFYYKSLTPLTTTLTIHTTKPDVSAKWNEIKIDFPFFSPRSGRTSISVFSFDNARYLPVRNLYFRKVI